MSRKSNLLSTALLFSLAASAASSPLIRPYFIQPRAGANHIALSDNWELCWRDTQITSLNDLGSQKKWIRVAHPTSVHMALHQAGELPHPYYNLNSNQYHWVTEKVWYYRKSFDAAALPAGAFGMLRFEGINYYARVWLNDTLLGSHEGMFGGPNVEVSKHLKAGSNVLVVEVRAGNYGKPFPVPGKSPGENRDEPKPTIIPWIFTGGLGAEDFYVMGMWRGVSLEILPPAHLDRPFLVTTEATPTRASLTLTSEVFVNAHSNQYEIHPWDRRILSRFQDSSTVKPSTKTLSVRFRLREPGAAKPAFEQTSPVVAFEGRNWFKQSYQFAAPKLWWPNGMGDPFLYRAEVVLLADGKEVDRTEFDFGIRTIKTVETPTRRTLDIWQDWQFLVNGRKFFVKGINWMPADLLLDLPASRYQWLLSMAQNAGFQMLRIWGGGLVETDEFYAECNRRGLLVWQDFPLSNALVSAWPLDVWEAQVAQNVFRLRNHPSLAVYCSGNESNVYAVENAGATGVFERTVISLDGSRPYRRTSPDAGGLHQYPDMDPTWYGRMYRFVPFVAETGMHNIPEARTIREVVASGELVNPLSNMFSEQFAREHVEFRHHFAEFNPFRVPRMLSRASHIDNMAEPTIESLAEASQVGAGEFYQVLSEQLQANYPNTAGLLPWVFKRPWPVVAIQLADGFGHPTAPYYFLKRTYEETHALVHLPHLLWTPGETIPLKASVTHASLTPSAGLVFSVEVQDDTFRSLYRKQAPAVLKPGPSVANLDLGQFTLPRDYQDRYFFVIAELRNTAGKLISRSTYWPRTVSMLADAKARSEFRAKPNVWPTLEKGPWLKPSVSKTRTSLDLQLVSAKPTPNGDTRLEVRIRNSGSAPSFMTFIDVQGALRTFFAADNFFWLQPGESRNITIQLSWREKQDSAKKTVVVSAWNAPPATVVLP